MSTVQTAGAKRSPTWTALRLFAELVAFAGLLFVTRFIMRGHLVPRLDEECHIGGIAVDMLAHGVRFPLVVYAQSEYDNGSVFSGLLVGAAFWSLGRSFLALKLVTHLSAAAGAVATLSLLRGCLRELGLTQRRIRWVATAALVIAIAFSTRVVTIPAMANVGLGAPLDGSVIDTVLLALFGCRWYIRSPARTAVFWVLAGFALYVNKATVPVLPVLGIAELALSWRSLRRLSAAAGGFLLGVLPEVLVITQRHGMGWSQLVEKLQRHGQAFPQVFLDSAFNLAERRIELVVAWALALLMGLVLLGQSWARARRQQSGALRPRTFSLVVGAMWAHIAALVAMAQGGFDYYTIYGYPLLAVLFAVFVAASCAAAAARLGDRAGGWVSLTAIAAAAALYHPDAIGGGFPTVASLWRNEAGAACSFRLAAGFQRELQLRSVAPGRTLLFYVIERCRSLAEEAQVLDCIGGIARELPHEYHAEVLSRLQPLERRAYAYYYGVRRNGDMAPCDDFSDLVLHGDCAAAVQLDCLTHGGWGALPFAGDGARGLHCAVPEPPIAGHWAEVRADLLRGTLGTIQSSERWLARDEAYGACAPVYDACR